jgi:hypothetical protein
MKRALLVFLLGCSDSASPPDAIFPADYAATYQEVRSCRRSLEHAANIRVLVSPDAYAPYADRSAPFPVGSIVLKEQYDPSDLDCAEPLQQFTVMQKLDDGWAWQQTDADLHEVDVKIENCINCHDVCGKPPQGYDGTCAEP